MVLGCGKHAAEATDADVPGEFIGSAACGECHAEQLSEWQGSHHELAMQSPGNTTVLGDFNGAIYQYYGSRTRFYRTEDDYFVETENADGDIQTFKVAYTFGVEPLQQYLLEGDRGRLQALTIAWDSRAVESGGQRWYHLYPDENVRPDDPLHWTGRHFTWNVMCAECHSTNLKVDYDLGTDNFQTGFDEISVGCEACHGPGSIHTAQARRSEFDTSRGLAVDLDDRGDGRWVMNAATGIAELNKPVRQQQPESCGRCHSRRAPIATSYEYGKPLTDTHMPALLEQNLYHADGRILDEVYVYGSFVQSKMYAAGVTCTDCHNPHTGNLRTGPEPNAVCAQCHLPSRFATEQHSTTLVGDCVACHMPATTYMGIDDRRDHSFRLPDAGAADSHYGQAIAAGRSGNANARLLEAVANKRFPAIARATQLSLIAAPAGSDVFETIRAQFEDPDPLVRVAALRALDVVAPRLRGVEGSFLLRDPIKAVRIEAARVFLHVRDLLPAKDAQALPAAIGEFREAQLASSSVPGAALQLAELESQLGNNAEAQRYYQHVLRLDPAFGAGHYAYGLYLVRSGDSDASLRHFQKATELAPADAHFAYTYGVALNSLGRPQKALEILQQAFQRHPTDYNIGFALATMRRDSGDIAGAMEVTRLLSDRFPNDPAVKELLRVLGQVNSPAEKN